MFDLLLGATVNIVAMVTAAKEAKTYHVIEVLRRRVTRSAAAKKRKSVSVAVSWDRNTAEPEQRRWLLFSLTTKLRFSVLCLWALGRRKNGLFVLKLL